MLNPDMARFAMYTTLGAMDQASEGSICAWLNANGCCNLTVCPACHVDDFVHVEGCPVVACIAQGQAIAACVNSETQEAVRDALKNARPFLQEQR